MGPSAEDPELHLRIKFHGTLSLAQVSDTRFYDVRVDPEQIGDWDFLEGFGDFVEKAKKAATETLQNQADEVVRQWFACESTLQSVLDQRVPRYLLEVELPALAKKPKFASSFREALVSCWCPDKIEGSFCTSHEEPDAHSPSDAFELIFKRCESKVADVLVGTKLYQKLPADEATKRGLAKDAASGLLNMLQQNQHTIQLPDASMRFDSLQNREFNFPLSLRCERMGEDDSEGWLFAIRVGGCLDLLNEIERQAGTRFVEDQKEWLHGELKLEPSKQELVVSGFVDTDLSDWMGQANPQDVPKPGLNFIKYDEYREAAHRRNKYNARLVSVGGGPAYAMMSEFLSKDGQEIGTVFFGTDQVFGKECREDSTGRWHANLYQWEMVGNTKEQWESAPKWVHPTDGFCGRDEVAVPRLNDLPPAERAKWLEPPTGQGTGNFRQATEGEVIKCWCCKWMAMTDKLHEDGFELQCATSNICVDSWVGRLEAGSTELPDENFRNPKPSGWGEGRLRIMNNGEEHKEYERRAKDHADTLLPLGDGCRWERKVLDNKSFPVRCYFMP